MHIHRNIEIIIAETAALGMFAAQHESQRARVVCPVWIVGFNAMPANICVAAAHIVAVAEVFPVTQHGVGIAEGDASFDKAEKISVRLQ